MKSVPHHKNNIFLTATAGLLAVILITGGCYRKPTYTPPETYPVTGKVVLPSGKVPAGSLIRFVPPDGNLAGEGTIEADGSFTLRTLFHEEWLDGAIEGADRSVEILIPLGANRMGGQTINVSQKFTIEPKENNFTVTLQ